MFHRSDHFSLLTVLWGLVLPALAAQDYTYYLTGDTTDIDATNTTPLVVLAGGGIDNDAAMRRFLTAAGGGDIVVIRASGSDGYNDYLFAELGVPVHSVETIRFDGPGAAFDDFVIERIRAAEGLFIAGGDQTDYWTYWRDTPIEDAIHYLALEKRVPVGGTSAGMAIMGQAYYAPLELGVRSSEALADPFHPYLDTIGFDDFLQLPYLEETITDTHFDQRERAGRTMAFLARLSIRANTDRPFAITANEATAVVIEGGRAYVYGEYPTYDDFAYFLHVNCGQEAYLPETMLPGQPLTWDRNEQAVVVYRVPGTLSGENYFQISNWESGFGGQWEFWSVVAGELVQLPGESVACIVPVLEPDQPIGRLRCYPNPVRGSFQIWAGMPRLARLRIYHVTGQLLRELAPDQPQWSTTGWPAGSYVVEALTVAGERYVGRLIVQ